MGAVPYFYWVKHQPDVNKALQELREREFRAGRYNPVMAMPFTSQDESPGAQHRSLAAALRASGEDGTRSILDIEEVGDEPDFGVAAPLDHETLQDLYGTTQPTRQMIEQDMSLTEDLERGHCLYTVAYKDGKPDEIFFAGYSYD